jgi:hypothetical protein
MAARAEAAAQARGAISPGKDERNRCLQILLTWVLVGKYYQTRFPARLPKGARSLRRAINPPLRAAARKDHGHAGWHKSQRYMEDLNLRQHRGIGSATQDRRG